MLLAGPLCIALGAHPKAIQERLGHSSITVTLDRYGHLFPKLDEALTERLDTLRQEAVARPMSPAAGRGVLQLPDREDAVSPR
jgi:hypothetical protein